MRLQNFWTKCPEVERRAYEVFTEQAVCSTLMELQLQKINEENHAGGSYTENDCPCFQVIKRDMKSPWLRDVKRIIQRKVNRQPKSKHNITI